MKIRKSASADSVEYISQSRSMERMAEADNVSLLPEEDSSLHKEMD